MPRQQREDKERGGLLKPVIAIAIIVALGYLGYPTIFSIYQSYNNPIVTLSGKASVAGFTAAPTDIYFKSGYTVNSVQIGAGGMYSIPLKNSQSYNVSVGWVATGGLSSGNCSIGTLKMQSSTNTMTYNVSC